MKLSKNTLIALIIFPLSSSIAQAKPIININLTPDSGPKVIEVERVPPHHPRRPHTRYEWVPVEFGNIPMNAVVGGREPGRELYICQANFHGGVHPGKVVDRRCNISYGGREIVRGNFNILVGRGLDWRPAHHGMIPPNAVEGGYENGNPLYVCRAEFQGLQPGKVVGNACNIAYGGQEIPVYRFQVLVSNDHFEERSRHNSYNDY